MRAAYHALVHWLSRRFVAGPQLADAVRAVGETSGPASLAYWNPPGESPVDVADRYLRCAEVARSLSPTPYVSMKLPALANEPHRIEPVLDFAFRESLRVHFDSLAEDAAAEVMELVQRRAAGSLLSTTLPGRWVRSIRDAEWVRSRGIPVRVVKGEWPGNPDRDPEEGFMEVVHRLSGSGGTVAVATHDAQLAGRALSHLRDTGTPCELEVLYGRPARAAIRIAERLDVPVRTYIPFGAAYLEYAVDFVTAHPFTVGHWLVRDTVAEVRQRWP